MSLGGGAFLLGYGARTWLSSPCDLSPSFYFPDFFLQTASAWFKHEYWEERSYEELKDFFQPIKSTKQDWINSDREYFIKGFDDLQKMFCQGKMEKAVPFAFELSSPSMSCEKLQNCLSRLLDYSDAHPVHVYGFWNQQGGILGGTPEVLFKIQQKEKSLLSTHACAGTRCYAEAASLFDEKERHEHQVVVRGIVESLTPFGRIQVGELKTLHLPFLSHLITPIEVELHALADFEKIVQALHPTPALGGFPKKESFDWMKDYQTTVKRARFGAPAGYIYKNLASCFVSIRNVQWNAERMMIGAGCGVVAKSQVDHEWKEINLKMQSIKEMLDL
ncbi:Salicylate biosynthesis isochorismate synthase [Parachlamydia sp. AcF125]|nr:Salicylate biosynthesis isochorismate synthase [Parachlamydia sp. AcF125]